MENWGLYFPLKLIIYKIYSKRNDGFAEKLFEELKEESNAKTYEAFILGLLKVRFGFWIFLGLQAFYL